MTAKPIVLATDGSPSAAEATLEAIALASALDAPLVVISVDHPSGFAGGEAFYGNADVLLELPKIDHERLEAALAQACAAGQEAGLECESVDAGDEATVADQICQLARRARMIVIGAHGWSPVSRVLHGSVSTAVVHWAHCPVLVVPPARNSESTPSTTSMPFEPGNPSTGEVGTCRR
jgi:nucleotide-binding universal stress UspA family protein